MSNENVDAARDALEDEVADVAEATDGFDVPEGDEQAATGPVDTGPSGVVDRLFRTDKSIDLENTEDFWDPDEKGAANRFAAACRQAFGVDNWPPVVHMAIAGAEAFYLALRDMFDFDSGGE